MLTRVIALMVTAHGHPYPVDMGTYHTQNVLRLQQKNLCYSSWMGELMLSVLCLLPVRKLICPLVFIKPPPHMDPIQWRIGQKPLLQWCCFHCGKPLELNQTCEALYFYYFSLSPALPPPFLSFFLAFPERPSVFDQRAMSWDQMFSFCCQYFWSKRREHPE